MLTEVNLLPAASTPSFPTQEIDVVDYNAYWYTGSPNGALGASGQYSTPTTAATVPATTSGTTTTAAAAQQNSSTFLREQGTPSLKLNGTTYGFMPDANVLADCWLGDYASVNATASAQIGHFHQLSIIMPYIRDDWPDQAKAHHQLLGMRYDYYSPPTEANGHTDILNPATGQEVLRGDLQSEDQFNFSPGTANAYALNDKTAIHAGGAPLLLPVQLLRSDEHDEQPVLQHGPEHRSKTYEPTLSSGLRGAGHCVEPQPYPGSTRGQLEIFNLADAEAIWNAMPPPTTASS